MHALPRVGGEDDLGLHRGQGGQQDPVGAVAHASLVQGTVEDYPELIGLRVVALEQGGSPLGTHGMGGRGANANLVDIADRFHKKPPLKSFYKCIKFSSEIQSDISDFFCCPLDKCVIMT